MPTVPKYAADIAQGDPGLLSDQNQANRPDASSVLMASSLMASMGRLGRNTQASGVPRRMKSSKGSGRVRSMIR